jgi:outer membrane protein assembly factor BamB
VIAVTESNNVYALDADSGGVVWRTNVGAPVPKAKLPCGDIDPLGITGTPAVDLPSRALFFDAMTTPDAGVTKQHLIFSLNVDTGSVNSGWPVDVNATARFGATVFNSSVQNQRGALSVIGGSVYVPYGGHFGDCGSYHGWLVNISLSDPSNVTAWATAATGGGSWSVGGVASDGVDPIIATGNTFGAGVWSGGESIIRLQAGAVFTQLTNHFWAPTNWARLDSTDTDLGGSSSLIVDVPGATPPQLVVALGKDGNAYLLNRTNLGGVSLPLAQAHISSSAIIQAAASYRTSNGTYVVCGANTSQLSALRILPTDPPTITNIWVKSQGGRGSPFVTSTDGTNDVVVWGIGSEGNGSQGDQRLHGFDPDTGATIFSGGGQNELMSGTRRFNTGIVARGRIYVAGDNKVYAFRVGPVPVTLTSFEVLTNGTFQIEFSGTPGMVFSVLNTTNISDPLTAWTLLGGVLEISPGQFQFIDPQPVSNHQQRFYRVRSP